MRPRLKPGDGRHRSLACGVSGAGDTGCARSWQLPDASMLQFRVLVGLGAHLRDRILHLKEEQEG